MINMPVKGFRSLTISEEDYRRLKERAERRGLSMAGVIGDILRRLEEGLDEPRVVETPSAPQVDVAGLEGQVRLLRAEVGGLGDRLDRLEEEPEEEPELEEPDYPVPEGLMEFMGELKEWCEAVSKSRVDECVNARSDRCPLRRGAPTFYCALFCVDFKAAGAREPILF